MKKPTKAQRQQAEADDLRALASTLLRVPHNDWTDWEFEWLQAQSNRDPSYRFSDKERAKLDQLKNLSKTLTAYSGYTVPELINLAYPARFDLGEDDQEFLEKLHGWAATDLKLRQARRLASLCRILGEINEAA